MTSATLKKSAFKKVLLCLSLLAIFHAQGLAQIGPPPVITAQPLDTNVVYGDSANFTVTAVSGTALSYQWYKEGFLFNTLMTGETRTNLVLTNVGDANAGKYFVTVMNASGTVPSRHAVLAVVTNSPPVAGNDSYSTLEDVPLVVSAPGGVLANDSDVNGQALTALLVTNVSQGNLSLNTNGGFTYTPNTNFNGSDSFTYRACDGYSTILEQNNSGGGNMVFNSGQQAAQSFQHGTAGGPSYMIKQVVLYLSRKSGGSANLNFSVGTGVNAGAIAGSSLAISSASITNTSQGSSFQTNVIVYGTPLGPFIAGTTYYLNFDNQSGQKVFVESPGNNIYTNGTFYLNGNDQHKDMRFQIYETILSNPATVTITVSPVNDPPVAVNDTYTTLEDVPLIVPAASGILTNDTDVDGDALTAVLVGNVTNGTLTLNANGGFTYLSATNYNGSDSFSYRANDGTTNGNLATVTINITPVNDPPVANNDAYITSENTLLTVPASGVLTNDTDVESDPLSASLVTTVSHGSLNLNADGSFTYAPSSNYFGSDAFTYCAKDLSATSTVATVSLTVRDTQTPLNFISEQMTASGFSLNLSAPWGYVCVVEASTNLVDWIPIFTNSTLSSSVVFTDITATNVPSRFYRAVAR
jgi:hypothetical protein